MTYNAINDTFSCIQCFNITLSSRVTPQVPSFLSSLESAQFYKVISSFCWLRLLISLLCLLKFHIWHIILHLSLSRCVILLSILSRFIYVWQIAWIAYNQVVFHYTYFIYNLRYFNTSFFWNKCQQLYCQQLTDCWALFKNVRVYMHRFIFIEI